MKSNSKVVAASLFAALLVAPLSADTMVPEPEVPVDREEEPQNKDEDAGCNCLSLFGGFWIGGSVGWNLVKCKTEIHQADGKVHQMLTPWLNYGAYDLSASKNMNRFVFTVMMGGGKLWDNGLYAGVNFYFDIGQSKKDSENVKGAFKNAKQGYKDNLLKCEMKVNSWSPALALRLGYVPASYNTLMMYLDLGAAYSKAEYKQSLCDPAGKVYSNNGTKETTNWYSANKVVPLVRVGLQKAIGSKFIAGLEVEYKFRGSKTFDDKNSKNTVKVRFAEGVTVRLIGTCNFKF